MVSTAAQYSKSINPGFVLHCLLLFELLTACNETFPLSIWEEGIMVLITLIMMS